MRKHRENKSIVSNSFSASIQLLKYDQNFKVNHLHFNLIVLYKFCKYKMRHFKCHCHIAIQFGILKIKIIWKYYIQINK